MVEKKPTRQSASMSTVVGGALCLVALAASIFSENDGFTCLLRGGAAFVGGYFVTQIWYLLVLHPQNEEVAEEPAPTEEAAESVTDPSGEPVETTEPQETDAEPEAA
jgi:hypothetical protein